MSEDNSEMCQMMLANTLKTVVGHVETYKLAMLAEH